MMLCLLHNSPAADGSSQTHSNEPQDGRQAGQGHVLIRSDRPPEPYNPTQLCGLQSLNQAPLEAQTQGSERILDKGSDVIPGSKPSRPQLDGDTTYWEPSHYHCQTKLLSFFHKKTPQSSHFPAAGSGETVQF